MTLSGNGILFAVKDALKNIKMNSLMSTASVFILVACIIIMGSSLLLVSNINRFITNIEDKNEIVLFLDETLTEQQIGEVKEKLTAIENIKDVTYVTKEQAFEEYKKELGENAVLMEGLKDKNPLRNSYHAKIDNLNKYDETMTSVKSISGVANIRDKKEIVDKILQLRQVLFGLAVWIIIILLFMALFIISNTVRLAMFTRKLEINIMKFVGATDNFIRLPFLIEGMVLGAIAGIISFLLQWYIYSRIISPLLWDMSLFKPLAFSEVALSTAAYFMLAGIVVGAIGSILPMRKYLKA